MTDNSAPGMGLVLDCADPGAGNVPELSIVDRPAGAIGG
jgi:hypothetical protein